MTDVSGLISNVRTANNAATIETMRAAMSDLLLIRTAINDPGQFLPRGDNYTEPIGAWSARAVVAALAAAVADPS